MKKTFKRSVSFLIVFMMAVSFFATMPFTAFAANDYTAHDDYYNVISKKDFELAPGVVESEIVLNNDELTHRQVAHVVEVDLSNQYTKVIPSYKGMVPSPENYGVQIMSEQAKWAEANGYGNVVAAMNLSLSWYDNAYYLANPNLVGEPLGYMVLNGEVYMNSKGQTSGAQTCVVINFDEKDGETRPADMPKVEIRATSSAITGWEEQVIPANFGFLVKDGVNQYKIDNNAVNGASRSFVGIKADGTFVMVMNDGRQSPYSAGFTNYEMAEFMLSLGCVQAVNGDGGGSSAFLSQRPGEELKINCSPSDGSERPTTHGILVISTAPATGEFVRATLSTDAEYFTPSSVVRFNAVGTDLVGTPAEIPSDVTWQLSDDSMGTIENGVFISNGKVGTATAQLVYNGEVVGEDSIEIVIPETLAFGQAIMTVPFDKEVSISLIATTNDGLNEVVLKDSDISFSTTNPSLGTFNGLKFTSVSEENAPADLTSTLTATLVHDTNLVATADLNLGKGSEVLFDFEDASDIDEWNIADVNGNDKGFYQNLSYATSENGQVHNGVGSMRVEMNPISANGISCGGYGQSDLFLNNGVVVENAKSIGFWAYIPDEYEHCWIRVLYWYDPDGDGIFDKKNTVTVLNQPEVYNKYDESAWKYFSIDVSAYSKILIPGLDNKENFGYNAAKNDANNFRFIEFMFPHTNTNDLWKTYGTINGLQTVYIDNITVDFSDAVEDREAPIFSEVALAENDASIILEKYNTITTTNNLITAYAKVEENIAKTNATGLDSASAKVYVDGVEVSATFANGRISIADVAVANGIHRIKFEISDNTGNKSVVIRLINVESTIDASTVQVVPADPTSDKLLGGSLYWMNINATDIETIKSIETVIDLNYGNHWELDHMVLADGFTASYSINEENNTATIVITRTGANNNTGVATIAQLPIRIIYYDTDINIDGYTAETYWNTYEFWPYDLKVDVDMGKITYTDGYTSDVIGAFSNEEFSVDTEMYLPVTQMDAAYKAEKGTAHVHTEKSVSDVEPSCTTNGINGKTYCEVCDSVVNWGTSVEAKGHSFEVASDGFYTCEECGDTFYYVNGEAITGWQTIEDNVYYFAENGVAADGKYDVDGHEYTFENFVLIDAAWEYDGVGLIGYWAGEQISGGWWSNPVKGHQYFFTGIYANTGIYKVAISTNVGWKLYYFDANGIWQDECTGIVEYKDDLYYVEKGICVAKGVVSDSEDNIYYFNSQFKAVKNCTYAIGVAKTNGLIEAGTYKFDVEGKMINPSTLNPDPNPEPEVKNGLVIDEDGEIRYYINGIASYAGLVQDSKGNYYYINSSLKAVTACIYGIGASKTNGLLPADKYEFGADGRMLNPPSSEPSKPDVPGVPNPEIKNGIVLDEDGAIRFYVNGVATYAGLVQDNEGNYYYINSSLKAVKGCVYGIGATKTNGLLPSGKYKFDAYGKMVLE